MALALKNESVDVFAHGKWTSVAAPGYGSPGDGQRDVFTEPNEGWLGGANGARALVRRKRASSPLASWPLPDRSPLTSVALPPGSQGAVGESGALAVGFDGTTLSYDASAGWLVAARRRRAPTTSTCSASHSPGRPAPSRSASSASILHWDGTSWSEDPQSISLTAITARTRWPSRHREKAGPWARTGRSCTTTAAAGAQKQPPKADSGVDITSVAVAGSEAFAIANGNLIALSPGGQWREVGGSELLLAESGAHARAACVWSPACPTAASSQRAARSYSSVKRAGQGFAYAAQPLEGIAVALAPFREADGKLRAYVSVAPPALRARRSRPAFLPATASCCARPTSGWQDLSHAQYAGSAITRRRSDQERSGAGGRHRPER